MKNLDTPSFSARIRQFSSFGRPTCFTFLAVALFFCLSGLLISPPVVEADPFPPYWGTAAVHYPPVSWPTDSAWIPYTSEQQPIRDRRSADPSNGGTSPQNYANVSSSCTDQSTPSVAWKYDLASNILFFRWRVEQIANTYATGPAPGSYSNVDPWKSAQWTVLLDIDGDGYREFAVHIDGATGLPATPIDIIRTIYSNTPGQSIDTTSPGIYELAHNPTAFVFNDGATYPILNFRNSNSPSPSWPNGSAETVWDYGTTRSTNVSTVNPKCEEYHIDYQIPLAMLDATSVGGPRLTADTPFCMAFVTANSNTNPLQKDFTFDGAFTGNEYSCVPCGDLITPSGSVIPQPIVTEVTATGCNTTTLTARIRDAIKTNCQDTLTTVQFYYYWDKNANNIADDGGSWTLIPIAPAGNPADPGAWTLTGWDTRTLNAGQYLIGVQATDDAVSGNANRTFSYLTAAQLPANALGETNYANPSPNPGVVFDTFFNSCGEQASLTKSVSPAYTSSGSNVTFTLTVRNNTSSPFNLTSITDSLPAGFSYQSAPAEGGTLAGSILTRPLNNATGSITWTFAGGTTVAAGASATLTFTAKVSTIAGTYTNSASAVTTAPDWGSLTSNPVDIGVGAPQLTILKTPSAYRATPGDTITYTITYSNDSPVNTTGVVITDTLPAGLDFIAAGSGGIYDPATRTITWTPGSLASGEGPYTVSYQVVVTQAANSRTENTATIDSNETSPATAKTAIYVPSPLQISKVANKVLVDPRGVAPANQVVYTISYRNTGTSNLTGTTITDTTMPGFTYTSNTGGGVPVEPTGDGYGDDDSTCESGEPCTVTWTIGNLNAGVSGSVTLTLTVTNPYTQMTNPASNTAVIDTNETGPFSDSASVVIRDYDCGVTKDRYYFRDLDASGYPYPWTGAAPGTPLPATQKRNYANRTAPVSITATDITVNISNDNELELAHFYMDPPLSRASGFSIAGTIDMQAYMSKDAGGKVNIIAYLYDYDPETGQAVSIGTQAADSGAGNRDNYLLTFSITPTGIVREGNLLMWRFTTQRNSTYIGSVSFHFDSSATTGTQAGLSYGDVCFAPLSVTMEKTVDKLEASAGQTLAYTISFTNSGQREVSGTTVVDTLPTGVTFTSATMNGTAMTANCPTPGLNQYCASGQTYTFEAHSAGAAAGVLAGGGTGTLVINVTINNPLVPSTITSLTNTARLLNSSTDPVEDSATTDITHTPTPDVFLQKSADRTLLNPGDTVTYTITAVNVGDATATNITVSDTIPTDTYFTYVAGSIAGGDSRSDAGSPNLSWTINSLAPGSTATLTFRMLVASMGVPDGVTYKDNSATATEGPRTSSSNTVKVAITINANLAITKVISSPVSTESVGTGNGLIKVFDRTLADVPVQMGSVAVSVDGTQVGADSGTGAIIGNNLAASTINYTTGSLHLEFLTAPANGAAITVTYAKELSPDTTVQYTLTVSSTGGSTATGVTVYDPVPTGSSYLPGSLIYDGAVQTDQSGDDNAYFDSAANRVVFLPGDMAADTSHTLKFSVKLDGTFGIGTTTVTNTASASSANTATKQASALLGVLTAPALSITKAAPSLLPYPVTAVVGNQTSATINVSSTQYITAGDHLFFAAASVTNSTDYVVVSVNSATQITLDKSLTVTNGEIIYPTIRFAFTYANSGNADATNVTIKDVLSSAPQATYMSASLTPTTAPAFNANGTVTWNLGTLSPGESGTVQMWVRPTSAGTYLNNATMSSAEIPAFSSNTTSTTVGAIQLLKSTSTPNVTNGAGGTAATYTITLRNYAAAASGISVTDVLPAGFTYTTPSVYTGGACIGPAAGAASPTWTSCTVPAGTVATPGVLTITFTATIAPTVGAGTYQNPVSAVDAFAPLTPILPFDEINTTAEDVTVTIPADLKVVKGVTFTDGCLNVGCRITYDITVTNVGTSTATSATVTEVLPSQLTYLSSTATSGAYDNLTNLWTIPGPISVNSSVVTSGGNTYTCIQNHTSALANQPPNTAYWVLGGTGGVAWAPAQTYTSASATLYITTSINTYANISNTATITASTFLAGATDTNPSNNTSTKAIVPTLVTLSSFRGYAEGGNFVVEWSTATETDTAGFYLFRLDDNTGRYRQINRGLLPALLNSQQGGTYSLVDTGASLTKSNTYLLVEIEGRGGKNTYGPFAVRAEARAAERGYDLNPKTADILSGNNAPNRSAGPEIRKNSIRKYVDSAGTIVITNSSSSSTARTAEPAVSDEIANFNRQIRPLAEAKKTQIIAWKAAQENIGVIRKQRQGRMIKLSVSREGLYYLDAQEISTLLGIPQNIVKTLIRTGNLAISSSGNAVAYLPARSSTGIFFHAQGTDSIYTKENIYWIYRGRGLQMRTASGSWPSAAGRSAEPARTFTETVHAEEDRIIVPVLGKDPASDYWFWDYIVGGDPSLGKKAFTVETYGAANVSSEASLTVTLHGLTDTGVAQDHHVVVSLNGTVIGEDRWKGAEERVITLAFSQGLLYSGTNTIELTGLLDTGAPYSVFYADAFDLSYERLYEARNNALTFTAEESRPVTISGFTAPDILVFDITDPNRPVLTRTAMSGRTGNYQISLTPSAGKRYRAVSAGAATTNLTAWADTGSRLSDTRNRADWLIIAPEALLGAARTLASYRQSRGLETMVVDLEDIMDEFNYGISSPEAIRDFLGYAYENWQKAPRYVVLAGGGTYDYKDNMGAGDNLIPTLMTETPQMLSPSDSLFGDADGDHVPEIAIGRLPVLSAEELQNVIGKIIAYEQTAGSRIVMLADNQDDGGNFPSDSNDIAGLVPSGYVVEKIYLSGHSLDSARRMLLDSINSGVSLLNYIGHAGLDRLANEGLLLSSDIASLQNSGRPFVLTAMTCTVGNFALPGYDALGEALVTKKDTGAAAVWAPTGLSFNFMAKILDEHLFRGGFGNPGTALGDLILDAFSRYHATGNPVYIIDIFNLQGDPAMQLW